MVGIGSGLNVPCYSRQVDTLLGVDRSVELWKLAGRRAGAAPFPVEFVEGSAEHLPADDEAFDTVVTTWTLCSIPDPALALFEMRRPQASRHALLHRARPLAGPPRCSLARSAQPALAAAGRRLPSQSPNR